LVDEHAGELVANGLVQQESQGGTIHPAGESQQHLLVAHLGANLSDGLLQKSLRGPGGLAAADVIDKIAHQESAALGVGHLGVKLHSVQTTDGIGNGSKGSVVRGGQGVKAWRQFSDHIPMAHPHSAVFWQVGEQVSGIQNMEGGPAILAFAGGLYPASQLLHHELHAVAHA
jgi:hypothetical protein